jgi:ectoine hydroxylase-related dioxygenase (phytanoyl-CoA dioxygenase family)
MAIAKGAVPAALLGTLLGEAEGLISQFYDGGHRGPDFWCYDDTANQRSILYRIHNLEKQGAAAIATLFHDGPLHSLASKVLGTPVRANVCALILKLPQAAGVPWHRDRVDVPPSSAINLSVFLDEATAENGAFEGIAGSHLFADDVTVEAARSAHLSTVVPIRAGDVLIHDVRLVHGSGTNHTSSPRRSIIIEFSAQQVPGERASLVGIDSVGS